MSKLIIEGPNKLRGEISVHGAKNSTLPLLAASMLCGTECILHNCPRLSDVDTAVKILNYLGCKVTRSGGNLAIDPSGVNKSEIPDCLMREMRSSIVFLGAMVSRTGKAKLSFPGGCELGPRPIDLHLSALRKMGVCIRENHGCLNCEVCGKLQGCNIVFSFPSVGATENVMIAAVLAKGTTVIKNAAKEPEICDLADFLNKCGAKICGAGESTIIIEGVDSLSGCEHCVIPDRIAATTFMAAAAITGGNLLIKNINPHHLEPVLPVFEESGCSLLVGSNWLKISAPERVLPIKNVRTMPYPGFPTDAQAPVMAVTCRAKGTSVFVENIFESRYKHVGELLRLGAHIKIEGRVAVVEGVKRLSGAPVEAPDLRGGAALIIAGLSADGITQVSGIKHVDRGYEEIEKSLLAIGAHIKRV